METITTPGISGQFITVRKVPRVGVHHQIFGNRVQNVITNWTLSDLKIFFKYEGGGGQKDPGSL